MRDWTPDLAVGVAEIDNQHKALFTKLNSLLDAMGKGTGDTEVIRLVDFLGQYVVDHFWTEEKYMARSHYPGAALHKLQHAGFIREFTKLKDQLSTRGVSAALVLGAHKQVSDWLVNHICKTDKVLGAFIKTKTAA